MPTFLVETYGRPAHERLNGLSPPVRCRRTIAIPRDEVTFHLVDGPSSRVVAAALDAAGCGYDRISEANEANFDAKETP